MNSKNPRFRIQHKLISILICVFFTLTSVVPPSGFAQVPVVFSGGVLPQAGTMLAPSVLFIPPLVRGIKIHPENPLRFDFIVDTGYDKLTDQTLREESSKLIKYFLASLTVPAQEMWVNLSPSEPDRIVPSNFGITEMGRDLLAQDYLLKQLTASLMYPEEELGQKFWDQIYAQAGTKDIGVDTFNKVWIVPDSAKVYQSGDMAFVTESRLKVMLEEDYLSRESANVKRDEDTSQDTKRIIREMIIPAIEKEVNEGENFATLRQIYNSMILATWFKRNLQKNILGKIYAGENKVSGVDIQDKQAKQKIYEQYLRAFEMGVYNYIKEDYDPVAQQIIPRKYFSGGVEFGEAMDAAMVVQQTNPFDLINKAQLAQTGVFETIVAELDPVFESDEIESVEAVTNENESLSDAAILASPVMPILNYLEVLDEKILFGGDVEAEFERMQMARLIHAVMADNISFLIEKRALSDDEINNIFSDMLKSPANFLEGRLLVDPFLLPDNYFQMAMGLRNLLGATHIPFTGVVKPDKTVVFDLYKAETLEVQMVAIENDLIFKDFLLVRDVQGNLFLEDSFTHFQTPLNQNRPVKVVYGDYILDVRGFDNSVQIKNSGSSVWLNIREYERSDAAMIVGPQVGDWFVMKDDSTQKGRVADIIYNVPSGPIYLFQFPIVEESGQVIERSLQRYTQERMNQELEATDQDIAVTDAGIKTEFMVQPFWFIEGMLIRDDLVPERGIGTVSKIDDGSITVVYSGKEVTYSSNDLQKDALTQIPNEDGIHFRDQQPVRYSKELNSKLQAKIKDWTQINSPTDHQLIDDIKKQAEEFVKENIPAIDGKFSFPSITLQIAAVISLRIQEVNERLNALLREIVFEIQENENADINDIQNAFSNRNQELFSVIQEQRDLILISLFTKGFSDELMLRLETSTADCASCDSLALALKQAISQSGLSWNVLDKTLEYANVLAHRYIVVQTQSGDVAMDLAAGQFLKDYQGKALVKSADEYEQEIIDVVSFNFSDVEHARRKVFNRMQTTYLKESRRKFISDLEQHYSDVKSNQDEAMISDDLRILLQKMYKNAEEESKDPTESLTQDFLDDLVVQLSLQESTEDDVKEGQILLSVLGKTLRFERQLSGLVRILPKISDYHTYKSLTNGLIDVNDSENILLIVAYQEKVYFYSHKDKQWSEPIDISDKDRIVKEELLSVPVVAQFFERTITNAFETHEQRLTIVSDESSDNHRVITPSMRTSLTFGPLEFFFPRIAEKGTWSFLTGKLVRVDDNIRRGGLYSALVEKENPENYLFFVSTPSEVSIFNKHGKLGSFSKKEGNKKVLKDAIVGTFFRELLIRNTLWKTQKYGKPNNAKQVISLGGDVGADFTFNIDDSVILHYAGVTNAVGDRSSRQIEVYGWVSSAWFQLEGQPEVYDVYRIADNQFVIDGIGDLQNDSQPVYVLYGDYFNIPNVALQLNGIVQPSFKKSFAHSDDNRSIKEYKVVQTEKVIPVIRDGRVSYRSVAFIIEENSAWERKVQEVISKLEDKDSLRDSAMTGEEDAAMVSNVLDESKIYNKDIYFQDAVKYFNSKILGNRNVDGIEDLSWEQVIDLYELFRGDRYNEEYSPILRSQRLDFYNIEGVLSRVNKTGFASKQSIMEDAIDLYAYVIEDQIFAEGVPGFNTIQALSDPDAVHPAQGHNRLAWFLMSFLLIRNGYTPFYVNDAEEGKEVGVQLRMVEIDGKYKYMSVINRELLESLLSKRIRPSDAAMTAGEMENKIQAPHIQEAYKLLQDLGIKAGSRVVSVGPGIPNALEQDSETQHNQMIPWEELAVSLGAEVTIFETSQESGVEQWQNLSDQWRAEYNGKLIAHLGQEGNFLNHTVEEDSVDLVIEMAVLSLPPQYTPRAESIRLASEITIILKPQTGRLISGWQKLAEFQERMRQDIILDNASRRNNLIFNKVGDSKYEPIADEDARVWQVYQIQDLSETDAATLAQDLEVVEITPEYLADPENKQVIQIMLDRGLTYDEAESWRRAKVGFNGRFPVGFWTNQETARNMILVTLDTIEGFREARVQNDVSTMRDLYEQKVQKYKPSSTDQRQDYNSPAMMFFRDNGGVDSLLSKKPEFLSKNSIWGLLEFALPELVLIVESDFLDADRIENILGSDQLQKLLDDKTSWDSIVSLAMGSAFYQALDDNPFLLMEEALEIIGFNGIVDLSFHGKWNKDFKVIQGRVLESKISNYLYNVNPNAQVAEISEALDFVNSAKNSKQTLSSFLQKRDIVIQTIKDDVKRRIIMEEIKKVPFITPSQLATRLNMSIPNIAAVVNKLMGKSLSELKDQVLEQRIAQEIDKNPKVTVEELKEIFSYDGAVSTLRIHLNRRGIYMSQLKKRVEIAHDIKEIEKALNSGFVTFSSIANKIGRSEVTVRKRFEKAPWLYNHPLRRQESQVRENRLELKRLLEESRYTFQELVEWSGIHPQIVEFDMRNDSSLKNHPNYIKPYSKREAGPTIANRAVGHEETIDITDVGYNTPFDYAEMFDELELRLPPEYSIVIKLDMTTEMDDQQIAEAIGVAESRVAELRQEAWSAWEEHLRKTVEELAAVTADAAMKSDDIRQLSLRFPLESSKKVVEKENLTHTEAYTQVVDVVNFILGSDMRAYQKSIEAREIFFNNPQENFRRARYVLDQLVAMLPQKTRVNLTTGEILEVKLTPEQQKSRALAHFIDAWRIYNEGHDFKVDDDYRPESFILVRPAYRSSDQSYTSELKTINEERINIIKDNYSAQNQGVNRISDRGAINQRDLFGNRFAQGDAAMVAKHLPEDTEFTVEVKNAGGIHMYPSSILFSVISTLPWSNIVKVSIKDSADKWVEISSMMQIVMLAANFPQGSGITFRVEADDSEYAEDAARMRMSLELLFDRIIQYDSPQKAEYNPIKDIEEEVSQMTADELQDKFGVPDSDAAMTVDEQNVGGIDLNSDKLDIEVQGEFMEFDLPSNLQYLQTTPINGFTPIILDILPTNLPLLLGVRMQDAPEPVAFGDSYQKLSYFKEN